MRIVVIRKPDAVVGCEDDVGNVLGALFLAEKWAAPIASDEPAMLTPLSEIKMLDEIRRLRMPESIARIRNRFDLLGKDRPIAEAADRKRKGRR